MLTPTQFLAVKAELDRLSKSLGQSQPSYVEETIAGVRAVWHIRVASNGDDRRQSLPVEQFIPTGPRRPAKSKPANNGRAFDLAKKGD